MQKIYKTYFEPVKFYGVQTEKDYESVQSAIKALDAFARVSHQSFYVIDYFKQNFIYVSPHRLVLNNLTVKDIQEMGYRYYSHVVPLDDLRFLEFVNKKGFEFFYQTPPSDERLKYTISYDFHICFDNKKKILVNHKLTPYLLNEKKQIWLALCLISVSSKKEKGEIVIRKTGERQKYIFNNFTGKWIEKEEFILNDIDINILRFSEQGYSNEDIAKFMYYNVNSIKFHKKRLYALLKVKNINEAIAYAYDNRLL